MIPTGNWAYRNLIGFPGNGQQRFTSQELSSMIVRRILVPDDVDVARAAGATEKPRNDITLRAPAAVVYERKAGFVPGEKLFAEAMLENSSTKPPLRAADFLVSATAQTILVIGLLALPLYFTEAIDIHQFNKTLLAAPPP